MLYSSSVNVNGPLVLAWWTGRTRLTQHIQRRNGHRQTALGSHVGRPFPAKMHYTLKQVDPHVIQLEVEILAGARRKTVNLVHRTSWITQRVKSRREMSRVAANTRHAAISTVTCQYTAPISSV